MIDNNENGTVVYISAIDIQKIHNEANPDHRISYQKARKIKAECKRLYEEENGKVFLYSEKLIPLIWYETYFGSKAMTPKSAKRIKSNISKK